MERNGFYGEYYRAKDNAFPDKCMIAFGGSVGKFLLSQMMAWEFAAAGMDVLILAYHGEPGLPKLLKDQPVDVIEKAAMWLKEHAFPYRFESRIYPHLGHFILPVRPYSSALFLSERKYKKECAAERKQSWEDTLAFLRAW